MIITPMLRAIEKIFQNSLVVERGSGRGVEPSTDLRLHKFYKTKPQWSLQTEYRVCNIFAISMYQSS